MRQLWIVLAACGAQHATAPDAERPADSAPAPDSPTDAPPLDPWTAPLGNALTGVTLSDGWTDLRALPAPMVIDGGWTDSLFATPDGLHLRFAYEPVDFFDFFISKGSASTITGPELAGDPATAFQLFGATLTGSGWTISADPVDSASIAMASPASNASGDLLVFTEYAGPSRLYYATLANSGWSGPNALPIGSGDANDDNAKIYGELATSVAIYFESNRGSNKQRTLYTTTYTAATDSFAPVTQLSGIATSASDDTQPFLTPDQQTLYFTSIRSSQYGVFTAAHQPDGSWADVHAIAVPTTDRTMYAGNVTLLGEASVVATPEGELLYMVCGVAEARAGSASYGNANYIALEPCVARRPKL